MITKPFPYWTGKFLIAAICLLPSFASWAAADTEDQIFSSATSSAKPLAMHIHMVHLREMDLREGKARACFEFHNAGNVPLKILQVKPSCGCVTTRMNQPEEGYKAGASGEFYLEVDTAAENAGHHEYQVKIEYQPQQKDAPSDWMEVTYRVEVPEKKVAVQPRALIFYQLGNEPTTQTVRITDFRNKHDLELLELQVKNEFITLDQPRRETDGNGHSVWVFSLTAAGNVPPGQQTSVVHIETNDAEFPELRLPVLIYGPPKQTASAKVGL